MNGFSGDLAGAVKVDNSPRAEKAKITIREHVLDRIAKASVFDAYAGAGQMHTAVWAKAMVSTRLGRATRPTPAATSSADQACASG